MTIKMPRKMLPEFLIYFLQKRCLSIFIHILEKMAVISLQVNYIIDVQKGNITIYQFPMLQL